MATSVKVQGVGEKQDEVREGSGLFLRQDLSSRREESSLVSQEEGENPLLASHAPANDDVHSVGQILQALQVSPSRKPYVMAGIISLLWGGLVGMWVLNQPTRPHFDVFSDSTSLILALCLIAPCFFFFICALFVGRLQEMRATAYALAKTAVRLSEPDRLKTEEVGALSQSIRREAASIGDGLERTIARAGELDSLVRKEVASIERAYTENERRLRTLIDSLTSERDSIVLHAERVREAISVSQETLLRGLEDTTLRVTSNVDDLAKRVMGALEEKGTNIVSHLSSCSETLLSHLEVHVERMDVRLKSTSEMLLTSLESRGHEVSSQLDKTGSRVSDVLSKQADELTTRLELLKGDLYQFVNVDGSSLAEKMSSISTQLDGMVKDQTQIIQERFAGTLEAVTNELDAHRVHSQEQLRAHGSVLAEQVSQMVCDALVSFNDQCSSLQSGLSEATKQTMGALDAYAAQFAHSIADHLTIFDEAIATHGDTLEKKFFSDGSKIQENVAAYIDKLTHQSSLLMEDLSLRMKTFQEVADSHGEALATQTVQLHDQLARVADETFATLGQNGEKLTKNLQEQLQLFQDTATAYGEALSTQGTQFQEQFTKISKNAVSDLEGQRHQLVRSLATELLAFQDAAMQNSKAVKEQAQEVEATFLHAITMGLGNIVERSEVLANQLANRLGSFQETLTIQHESMVARSTEVNAQLKAFTAEAFESFDRSQTQIVGQLGQRLQDFSQTLEEKGRYLEETMGKTLSALKDETSHQNALLDHYATAFDARLDSAIQKVAVSFSEKSGLFLEQVETCFEKSDAALGMRQQVFVDSLTDRVANLTIGVEQQLEAVRVVFGQEGEALGRHLLAQTQDIAQTLETRLEKFSAQTSCRAADFTKALEDLLTRVDSGLETRVHKLNETLTSRVLEVARAVGDGGREAAQLLDTTACEIEQVLQERSESLVQSLSEKTKDIRETLGKNAEELADIVDGRVKRFEERIVGRLEHLTQEIDQKGVHIVALLGTKIQEISTLLEDRTLHMDQALSGKARHLAEELQTAQLELSNLIYGKGQHLLDAFRHQSADLEQILGGRGSELHIQIMQYLQQIDKLLSENGMHLVETLSGRCDELHNLFETGGPLLAELISNKGSEIVQQCIQAGENFTQTLETQTHSISKALGREKETLIQTTDALQAVLEASASKSITNVVGTTQRVRDELTDVLDQFSDATQQLETTVQQASYRFLGVETALAQQVKEIQSVLGLLGEQVDALGSTSRDAVQNVEGLADRLEQQNRVLGDHAALVSKTQHEVSLTLAGREEAIGELIESMAAKTHTFDQKLKTFTSMVDDFLSRAEQKAREMGLNLTKDVQEVTQFIDTQYQTLRQASERESGRTLDVVRGAYVKAQGEISELFSDSEERFRSVAQDVQTLAHTMHKELEETREIIRRGTEELPKGMTEQLSLIRRTISEQFNALNELSQLIARSGRALEVSALGEPEPVRYPPMGYSSRRRERPASSYGHELSRSSASAPALAPTLAHVSQPAPAPRQREDILPQETELQPREEVLVAPKPQVDLVVPVPPSAPLAKKEEEKILERTSDSWLSQLLERASSPEEETSTALVLPDPTSPDIAKMVRKEEVLEAWDQYRSGKKDAFTKDLYTKEGQLIFEELVSKYQKDIGFRETVDQYTSGFERVMADVIKEDEDGSLARAYLVSESGRIYTMLAHISGRLG